MSAPLAKQQLSLMQAPSVSYATPRRSPSFLQNVANSLRWIAQYPRRMAVVDELQRLTDRELNDIGLTRSEVRTVFSRNAR